ncbi:hypothetical protein EDC04DRAFT_2888398 [Pisolithus marmoratus]|nr:hypothetical protein EDC04DRAFT_2888398 [Pisolithus marmoratus]
MAPSHCQTPLRCSLHVSAQSHNPTSTPRPRHTRSSTTEELLTKITKVMDVVEKDMKLRHSETRQLRQQVCQAEKTRTLAEDRCPDLQKNISAFATSQAYITKCIICQCGMEQPFTIVECGHSFCYDCLKIWFHTLLEKQISWQPSIPLCLKSAPFTADKLRELFDEGHIFSTRYSCPLCRKPICNKPIRVFLTADLITAIGALVPQDFPVNNPLPSDEDIWADVFYTKHD